MAFAVTIETIRELKSIPAADRIEQAFIEGSEYSFVVQKNIYKPGDKIVYFPIDAILSEDILNKLGLNGKLSGGSKNRVKTVKLRGTISQGIVCKPDVLDLHEPFENLTEKLNVKKYEIPERHANGGKLTGKPECVYTYDIENAQNVPEFVKWAMDKRVVVTEKLEGMHISVTIDRQNRFYVCSRNYGIEPIEGEKNIWLDVVKRLDIESKLREYIRLSYNDNHTHVYTFRGELIGPNSQDNYYELSYNSIYWFEFEIDGKPIDAVNFYNQDNALWKILFLQHAPILAYDINLSDYLKDKSIVDISNGNSKLHNGKLREGIVIKLSMEHAEQVSHKLTRNFIKVRSPDYLAKTNF